MAGKKRIDNKGRILRTGEQQRSQDGRYMYRYTDLSGKRRTLYAMTLQELREKEKLIERDLQDGIDSSKGDMTLNQLFQIYMETKSNIRESTRFLYRTVWKNNVENSALGNFRISQIRQLNIKAFYSNMAKRGLAENTIKLCHSIIFSVLELAVDSDIIRKNPAKNCAKEIGGTKKKKTAMTIAEQERLLEFMRNEDRYIVYYPIVAFALSTGLRIGELTGLRWSDVDLEGQVVHIRRQLVYLDFGDGYRFHVQELKTEAGRRDIPLITNARRSLLKQKEISLMLGKMAKQQEVEGISDFVFINSQGKPYTTGAVNRILYDVVKAYNKQEEIRAKDEHREPEPLSHISAHALRHAACSRFAESGLDPKVLQYIMGHSNFSVTYDVYTHMDFSQIQKQTHILDGEEKIG